MLASRRRARWSVTAWWLH